MQEKLLLEQIWANRVEVRERKTSTPLTSILELMLPEDVIILSVSGAAKTPYAIREETELLPGVSLGDILEEELNIRVPQSAVVIVEPAKQSNEDIYSAIELESILLGIMTKIAPVTAMPNLNFQTKSVGSSGIAEYSKLASA